MKVKELIEELGKFDPEADVRMEQPSGDYWGTVLAVPIYKGELTTIEWDDACQRCEVVKEFDGESSADGPTGKCVLLRECDDDMDPPEWAEREEEE